MSEEKKELGMDDLSGVSGGSGVWGHICPHCKKKLWTWKKSTKGLVCKHCGYDFDKGACPIKS